MQKQVLNEQQIILKAKLLRLENEDKKEDAQRYMIWFLLIGMLLYPLLVIVCSFINLDNAAKLLEDMSNIYFMSISGLIAVYFGANAYSKSKTIDSMEIQENRENQELDS